MMGAGGFISSKLRFRESIPVWATAISFFIIIVALAVAGGFRSRIRGGITDMVGDISLSSGGYDMYGASDPVPSRPDFLPELFAIEGVAEVTPVICRAGIVKSGPDIYGVLMKGSDRDSIGSLMAEIPRELSKSLRLGEGDSFNAFFVGEKVKARKFTVAAVYDNPFSEEDNIVVRVNADDLRRINGWGPDAAGALEIRLEGKSPDRYRMRLKAMEAASVSGLCAEASTDSYSQIFDWLDLIDFNVNIILILMTVVAGFNMISGLLIMLLRNIPTIGMLKTMGMTGRRIAGVFLRVAARATLKGMLAGNAAALLFCLIQDRTGLIRLNPQNYFVSEVPVHIDAAAVLAVDAIAFAAITLLLLSTSLFISRVDPARSVKAA